MSLHGPRPAVRALAFLLVLPLLVPSALALGCTAIGCFGADAYAGDAPYGIYCGGSSARMVHVGASTPAASASVLDYAEDCPDGSEIDLLTISAATHGPAPAASVDVAWACWDGSGGCSASAGASGLPAIGVIMPAGPPTLP